MNSRVRIKAHNHSHEWLLAALLVGGTASNLAEHAGHYRRFSELFRYQ